MAKKIRNFAAILAISAVVGTMLLILVFLLPVGPMRRNVEKRYPEFFLIIGILTFYFDFLTYPITTLGIPLCCYFLLENDRAWNGGCSHYFYCFDRKAGKKITKKLKKPKKY